jgi:hypothetical protein
MKRQIARKRVSRAPAHKKIAHYPARKGAHKFVWGAQMTNYLLEEHPEFGQC